MPIKTLKIRVKDKHRNALLKQGNAVNYVWNYCNELSYRILRDRNKWLSSYDFQPYTKGSGKELGLHSQTIQQIQDEYVLRRKQFRKARLNWRKSFDTRRSLGWIPFKGQAIKYCNGGVKFNGKVYNLWDTYNLKNYKFKAGCFCEDARGRWYFCVAVEYEAEKSKDTRSIGIDLGCKETATDSNADGIKGREYRKLENKLKVAQRAKNSRQVKTIHAKIKNRRHDAIHKYSRMLVNNNAAIFVGNISSSKLVKTKMAKSVLDASWATLKMILEYKCGHAGIIFEEINEAYTTQTCSNCLVIPNSSPKGRTDLGIREWTCSECGTLHHRDVNAAMNILRLGLGSLVEESSNL